MSELSLLKKTIVNLIDDERKRMTLLAESERCNVENSKDNYEALRLIIDSQVIKQSKGEVAVHILKEVVSPYESIKCKDNEVEVAYKDIYLTFSLNEQLISVKYNFVNLKPSKYEHSESKLIELYKLWKMSKDNKVYEERVINDYSQMFRKKRASKMYEMKVKLTKEIDEYMQEIGYSAEPIIERNIEYNREYAKYKKEVDKLNEAHEELKGNLDKFERKGWKVKYLNVKRKLSSSV